MYKLEPHQIKFSKLVLDVLLKYNIAYLAGEVRSRKTGTVLEVCRLFKAKNVLIITKKKAISSIESDYKNFGFKYNILVINYESLHKIKYSPDLVIYDEAHSLGAYPKPSNRTKLCKKLFKNIPCILMSGTPAVESYSQLYHQFFISDYSPFKEYINFYKWANDFVDKKEMKLPTHTVIDYSGAKVKDINNVIKPYFIKMTQADAGFKSKVKEHILTIETPVKISFLVNKLLKDKVLEGKDGYIIGDSPAKLQSKAHQLINGHCIIEKDDLSTSKRIFDTYKADYIKTRFKGVKIAIMYYYQSELDILKNVFAESITTDLQEFNNSNKNLALQCLSTEGMNVSSADAIVYMNLGFSGKAWLQSRDRLTVRGRKDNKVYIICEDFGLTEKIHKIVSKKGNFNTKLFKKWHQDNRQS